MTALIKKLSIVLLIASFAAVTSFSAHAMDKDAEEMIMIDLKTERAVVRAINSDAQLSSYPLIVGCVDGVITLHGVVESSQDKALVEKLAKTVEGVKSVRNSITVNS